MFDILAASTTWAKECLGQARQPKPTSTAIRTNLGDGRTVWILPFLIEFWRSRVSPARQHLVVRLFDAAFRIPLGAMLKSSEFPRSAGRACALRIESLAGKNGIPQAPSTVEYSLDGIGLSLGIIPSSKAPANRKITWAEQYHETRPARQYGTRPSNGYQRRSKCMVRRCSASEK